MTEALDAMVKAMVDELNRQSAESGGPMVVDLDGVGRTTAEENGEPYTWGPQGVLIDGEVDLEKVARAGLLAAMGASHVGFRWKREGLWVTSYARDEIPSPEKQWLYALDAAP